MTRDKLDTLWSSAVHAALNAGEDYARYHFAALLRDHLISEGWRQCAKEQRTTQLCAMAEQAKQEERQRCARIARQWDVAHPSTNFGGCIARFIEGDNP
jgi:hypothetical protein